MSNQCGNRWFEASSTFPVFHRSSIPEVLSQMLVPFRPQLEGCVAKAAAGSYLGHFGFPTFHGFGEAFDLVDLAQVLS
jgi:hypothetical protein